MGRSITSVAQNAEKINEMANASAIGATQLDRSIRSVAALAKQADEITRRVSREAAVRGADRARALIADRTAASGERVTISAGVAPLTAGVSPSAVVATADAAAYAAKRAGRDRVVVAVPKLTVTTDATEATESARPAT